MNRTLTSLAAASAMSLAVLAPAAAATPDAGAGIVAKSYSKSTVAKHNKASNCWTIVGKNVYNLTGFVKKHPGGASRIIRLCGKNGTAAFRAQHGSTGKANTVLRAYKIGTVK